jgi:alpha-glucosidase
MNKLLLSLKGTIFMYQGEELGLTEAKIPFDRLQDPWGIHHWPEWEGRDGCRTPMPWKAGEKNAGFSAGDDTWLPIPAEHIDLSVDRQEQEPGSPLLQIKEFLRWRKLQPALLQGDIKFHKSSHDSLIIFDRYTQDSRIRCIFNVSEESIRWNGKDTAPLSADFIAHN